MTTPAKTLVDLETRFWQSMVDHDTDVALHLLGEPALMVSARGAMKFDHAGYRRMAEHGDRVLTSFELADMDVSFPNDQTAILTYHVKQGVAPRAKPQQSSVEEMNDSSIWIRENGAWKCVMHTEAPAARA